MPRNTSCTIIFTLCSGEEASSTFIKIRHFSSVSLEAFKPNCLHRTMAIKFVGLLTFPRVPIGFNLFFHIGKHIGRFRRQLVFFVAVKQTFHLQINLNANELLIVDDELFELLNDEDASFFSAAKELSVPAALLDFKFRVLKYKGYRMETPYIANGDFLKNDIEGCFREDDCY